MSRRSEHDVLRFAQLSSLWFVSLTCASCSLQDVTYDECETNGECRAAFGVGSTCSSDGLCIAPQRHSRCAESFPPDLFDDPVEHRDSVVFGALFDFENPAQRARQQSARLAIAQMNLEGGLQGRNLGLVSCNIAPGPADGTGATLDGALASARYLAEVLEVPALLGPASSTDVGSVFQQVRDLDTFVISPSATSPDLTSFDETSPTDDRPGLLWRTAPPDSIQGEKIAADMIARNVASVSVIAQAGSYGEALLAAFDQNFPLGFELHVFANLNQLDEAVEAVGKGNAREVLFLASSADDVVAFLNASATSTGFGSKTLFLTDAAATQDTLDRGPRQAFPRIRGTRPRPLDMRDPVYGDFIARYAAEYQSDVTQFSYTAHAYDMAWMTALGAAWALWREGELNGTNIAKGARHLSSGNELALTPGRWNAALQSIRVGEGVDVRGASGALDYSPKTEETSGEIDLWYIDTTGEPRIATRAP